jgi:hypothetical protein
MPDPIAELTQLLQSNAAKMNEVLKVPFTVPLTVGNALIEGGSAMAKGGAMPTPQALLQQTSALLAKTSPFAILGKGSEIVGEERATQTGGRTSRTTIF